MSSEINERHFSIGMSRPKLRSNKNLENYDYQIKL